MTDLRTKNKSVYRPVLKETHRSTDSQQPQITAAMAVEEGESGARRAKRPAQAGQRDGRFPSAPPLWARWRAILAQPRTVQEQSCLSEQVPGPAAFGAESLTEPPERRSRQGRQAESRGVEILHLRHGKGSSRSRFCPRRLRRDVCLSAAPEREARGRPCGIAARTALPPHLFKTSTRLDLIRA